MIRKVKGNLLSISKVVLSVLAAQSCNLIIPDEPLNLGRPCICRLDGTNENHNENFKIKIKILTPKAVMMMRNFIGKSFDYEAGRPYHYIIRHRWHQQKVRVRKCLLSGTRT